uniref:Uncharacterized protein n=1 Tax=Timema tahoe TaxID=61484 RepID=A0A7R9NZL0_9NEOP|nr:unnamed protein product [Timema tahoe]
MDSECKRDKESKLVVTRRHEIVEDARVRWEEQITESVQMIETECFKELNVFGPNNTTTLDLVLDAVPEPEKKGCFPFRRKKKQSARMRPVPISDQQLESTTRCDS